MNIYSHVLSRTRTIDELWVLEEIVNIIKKLSPS